MCDGMQLEPLLSHLRGITLVNFDCWVRNHPIIPRYLFSAPPRLVSAHCDITDELLQELCR